MKQKIYVLIVALMALFATLTAPRNIHVIATEYYGDPEINYSWIYNKTALLSDIGKRYERGRYFGTDGELKAADDIKSWMENISLDCVHKEAIDKWSVEQSFKNTVKKMKSKGGG